jgi:nitrogen permease regulator 2-like protein
MALLDGEHHTDELAVGFEAGWPLLEQWLVSIGDGKGDGDFGKVLIIYR